MNPAIDLPASRRTDHSHSGTLAAPLKAALRCRSAARPVEGLAFVPDKWGAGKMLVSSINKRRMTPVPSNEAVPVRVRPGGSRAEVSISSGCPGIAGSEPRRHLAGGSGASPCTWREIVDVQSHAPFAGARDLCRGATTGATRRGEARPSPPFRRSEGAKRSIASRDRAEWSRLPAKPTESRRLESSRSSNLGPRLTAGRGLGGSGPACRPEHVP